eukprot:Pompholyxophrys_punicea_v1_NODE_354_length_2175_cov_25.166509.p2 type:complete len:126 gc:universal NODE_354_length_2175_cov_25.166509:1902-1525(-)
MVFCTESAIAQQQLLLNEGHSSTDLASLTDEQRWQVLDRTDFAKISLSKQEQLLRSFKGVTWRELPLRHVHALTDITVKPNIVWDYLTRLDITDAPRLSDAFLPVLFERATGLQKLCLVDLPLIR